MDDVTEVGGKVSQGVMDDAFKLSGDNITKEILNIKPKNAPSPKNGLIKVGKLKLIAVKFHQNGFIPIGKEILLNTQMDFLILKMDFLLRYKRSL